MLKCSILHSLSSIVAIAIDAFFALQINQINPLCYKAYLQFSQIV